MQMAAATCQHHVWWLSTVSLGPLFRVRCGLEILLVDSTGGTTRKKKIWIADRAGQARTKVKDAVVTQDRGVIMKSLDELFEMWTWCVL